MYRSPDTDVLLWLDSRMFSIVWWTRMLFICIIPVPVQYGFYLRSGIIVVIKKWKVMKVVFHTYPLLKKVCIQVLRICDNICNSFLFLFFLTWSKLLISNGIVDHDIFDVTVFHRTLIKLANTILSYRPKCLWKLYLRFKDFTNSKSHKLLLHAIWIQTIYHFKAKDTNYLNMSNKNKNEKKNDHGEIWQVVCGTRSHIKNFERWFEFCMIMWWLTDDHAIHMCMSCDSSTGWSYNRYVYAMA